MDILTLRDVARAANLANRSMDPDPEYTPGPRALAPDLRGTAACPTCLDGIRTPSSPTTCRACVLDTPPAERGLA